MWVPIILILWAFLSLWTSDIVLTNIIYTKVSLLQLWTFLILWTSDSICICIHRLWRFCTCLSLWTFLRLWTSYSIYTQALEVLHMPILLWTFLHLWTSDSICTQALEVLHMHSYFYELFTFVNIGQYLYTGFRGFAQCHAYHCEHFYVCEHRTVSIHRL